MTAFNRPSKDHVENILINYKDKISIPQIPTQTDLLFSPNTYEASTGILESIFSKIGPWKIPKILNFKLSETNVKMK